MSAHTQFYCTECSTNDKYQFSYLDKTKCLNCKRSNWPEQPKVFNGAVERRSKLPSSIWSPLGRFFNNRCLACGKEAKLVQDHIVPLRWGGTNDLFNFQPICRECNSFKSSNLVDYRPEHMNMSCE